jgi:hypothetical protein
MTSTENSEPLILIFYIDDDQYSLDQFEIPYIDSIIGSLSSENKEKVHTVLLRSNAFRLQKEIQVVPKEPYIMFPGIQVVNSSFSS